MKVKIFRTDKDFQMKAENEQGHSMQMDAVKDIGGNESGFRPMQLLLIALGGCASIDVLQILKKQRQKIDAFEVEIEGHRTQIEDYSLFKDITLHFKVAGNLSYEKLEKAILLSLGKYCSVAKTLAPTASINYKITIHAKS